MHVSSSSIVADHCRAFALSDPKEPAFQSVCDQEHTDACDRCEMLASVIREIEAGLVATRWQHVIRGEGRTLF